MLASFIVRLVITDCGSIRHGLMQCSIAFSIATQGRRTQGARRGGNPPTLRFCQFSLPMDMVNPISIRSGSDIPRSEFSDLPRALSHFYFDGEISAERSTNFHILIFLHHFEFL